MATNFTTRAHATGLEPAASKLLRFGALPFELREQGPILPKKVPGRGLEPRIPPSQTQFEAGSILYSCYLAFVRRDGLVPSTPKYKAPGQA